MNFNSLSYFSWPHQDPALAEVTPEFTTTERAAIMTCDIRDECDFLGMEHWRIAYATGACVGLQILNMICNRNPLQTRKALKYRLIALASSSLLTTSYTAMALMSNFCEETRRMELQRESDARDYKAKFHMS